MSPFDLPNQVPQNQALRQWSGQRLPRKEDHRLVTGAGRYVADMPPDRGLHAVVVRSQVAHGMLRRVDARAARTIPGVAAVLTATEAALDRLGGIPWEVCPPGREHLAAFPGDPAVAMPQPLLAGDRVRYVGEPVAFVVADTLATALDAAERVLVEIDALPPVIGVSRPRNEPPAFSYTLGDAGAMDAIMRAGACVATLATHIPRLVANPIETRGYHASFDPATADWVVVAAAGKPHPARDTIAHHVFGVPPSAIRLVANDVGGGFGAKNVAHAEMALVLWAARRLQRPVRWQGSRTEAFLSDMQARDHAVSARLAVAADGAFLGICYRSVVDLGAYLGPRAVIPALHGITSLTGPYAIPAVHAQVDALHSNTVPTCPYRGAGVPEAAFVVERLVDLAAHRLGLDPAVLRRRNLVQPADLPWPTPTGTTLHSVDFPSLLDAAVARSRWAEPLPPASGPRRRGRGMAFTLEAYGTTYGEQAEIVQTADGVEVRIGTKSNGQGHETMYAQVAADVLGLDPARIAVVQGDTARVAQGHGTGASRSTTTGGSAVQVAALAFLDTARGHAATLLQCRPDQLDYEAGAFARRGHPGVGISLESVARAQPGQALHVTAGFHPRRYNFPSGCHVAEVEVDVETGSVRLLRYTAVHDAGRAINPMIVEGQLHGGVAQGVGAALMEAAVIDDSGQVLAASFLDYALPRAGDLPALDAAPDGRFCASNPLGAKAVGEAGTVAAPPAVINAIVAALHGDGVTHLDMPATPQQVWRALTQARR